MKRLLLMIVCLTALFSAGQSPLTRDSFFLKQKSPPENYKSIIMDTQWMHLGTWHSHTKKIKIPDSLRTADLMLFEDRPVRRGKRTRGKSSAIADTASLYETVMVYHKIKGNKIVSNTDFNTERIVYVDSSTLILEGKRERGSYRSLYRRQK